MKSHSSFANFKIFWCGFFGPLDLWLPMSHDKLVSQIKLVDDMKTFLRMATLRLKKYFYVIFKMIWTHREYQWEAGLDKMRQDHHWWCYRSINSVKDKGTEWGEKKMYVCTTLKPNIHKTSRSQWCPIKRLNLNHASKYLTWSYIRQHFMLGKKQKCWSILR